LDSDDEDDFEAGNN